MLRAAGAGTTGVLHDAVPEFGKYTFRNFSLQTNIHF